MAAVINACAYATTTQHSDSKKDVLSMRRGIFLHWQYSKHMVISRPFLDGRNLHMPVEGTELAQQYYPLTADLAAVNTKDIPISYILYIRK